MANIKFSEFSEELSSLPSTFVVGYDSVSNTNKRISASNLNTKLVQNVTYAELVSLIGASSLRKGEMYFISDFQTIYDQPDYNSDGSAKAVVATLSGSVEPLLVTAIGTNKIDSLASSSVYPVSYTH